MYWGEDSPETVRLIVDIRDSTLHMLRHLLSCKSLEEIEM